MTEVVCDVCGRKGVLVPNTVAIGGVVPERGIGRCHRCHQFICLRHADASEGGQLYCPFDPGVPLGTPDPSEGQS